MPPRAKARIVAENNNLLYRFPPPLPPPPPPRPAPGVDGSNAVRAREVIVGVVVGGGEGVWRTLVGCLREEGVGEWRAGWVVREDDAVYLSSEYANRATELYRTHKIIKSEACMPNSSLSFKAPCNPDIRC